MYNRNLDWTFGVRSLPAQFFYKDGMWYEQNYMQILVTNIRTFIEYRHLEDQYVYSKFPTPTLVPRWAIPIKQVYNDIWKAWMKEYKVSTFNYLKETKVYGDTNILDLFDPYLLNFFHTTVETQVNIIFGCLVTAFLLGVIILICLLRTVIRRCKKSKEVQLIKDEPLQKKT